MVKLLHSADWQIGAQRTIPGSLLRQRQALDDLLRHAEREDVEGLLVAGDIFEHSRPLAAEKDLVMEWLHSADRNGINVFMIPGNHDHEDKALLQYHALKTFKLIEDRFMCLSIMDSAPATVVELPSFVVIGIPPGSINEEGLDPVLWPDPVYGRGSLTCDLLDENRKKPVVLMLHGSVQGVNCPNLPQEGLLEQRILSKLPVDYLALGDVHIQQRLELGEGAPEAWYPGSLIQKNFGEKYEESGALVVEFDGRQVVSVRPVRMETPARLWTGTFDITDGGRYKDPELLKQVPEGSIAKVVVVGTAEHLRAFDADLVDVRDKLDGRSVLLNPERRLSVSVPDDESAAQACDEDLRASLTIPVEEDLTRFVSGGVWPVPKEELLKGCLSVVERLTKKRESSVISPVSTLELLRLRADNALSYESIDVPLDSQGLVCILGVNRDTGGSNASGKSTILDLIEYSLFGTTSKGIKHDALINSATSQKWAEIQLEFRGVDGNIYSTRVRRRFPKTGNSYDILDGAGDPLTLKMKIDEQIGNLIGISDSLFRGAISMSQEGVANEFVLGTDQARQLFLTNLFDLDVWREAELSVRALRKDVESRIVVVKSKIATLENVVESATELDDITELEAALAEWTDKRSNTESEKTDHSGRRSSLKVRIDEVKDELRELRRLRSEAEEARRIHNEIREKKQEIDDLNKRLMHYADDSDRLHQDMTREIERVARHREALERLSKQMVELKSSDHLSTCPLCRQVLEEDTRVSIIDRIQEDLTEEEVKLERSSRRVKVARELARLSDKKYRLSLDIEKTSIPDDIPQDVEEDYRKLEDRLDSLKSELDKTENLIADCERDLRKYEAEISKLNERMRNLSSHSSRMEDQILQLTKSRDELIELERKNDVLSVAERDVFPKFRVYKIRHILDSLNREVNSFLSVLSDEFLSATFMFRQKGKTEDLDLVVEDPVRGKLPIKARSGGEKKRVIIATMFALWRLAMVASVKGCNYAAFDEIFRDVDGIGRTRAIKMFQQLRDQSKTILITTNDDVTSIDATSFDQVWVVLMEGGRSRLLTDQAEVRALLAEEGRRVSG